MVACSTPLPASIDLPGGPLDPVPERLETRRVLLDERPIHDRARRGAFSLEE